MTVDVGLWQRPRWGVGSVRLHLDVEDLAWGMGRYPTDLPQLRRTRAAAEAAT